MFDITKKQSELKHYMIKYKTAANVADKAYFKGRMDQLDAEINNHLRQEDKAKFNLRKANEHFKKFSSSFHRGDDDMALKHIQKNLHYGNEVVKDKKNKN